MAGRDPYRNTQNPRNPNGGYAGPVSDETRYYAGGFTGTGNGQSQQTASGTEYGYNKYAGYDGGSYSGYPQNGADYAPYEEDYYTDSGYVPDQGYSGGYTDGGYDYGYEQPQEWYRDAGRQGETAYTEAYRRPKGPSMAQRATGKASNDPYRNGKARSSKAQQSAQRPQARSYAREEDDYVQRPVRKKRRKRRHPIRNLFVFLLILAVLVIGAFFLLMNAPKQSQKLGHTRKDDFYNIMVCATDEDGTRTDTIMMLTLDQGNQTIALTSIPRDTLQYDGDKLNSVYAYAGCGDAGAVALMDRLEEMLGFRADGYMIISYQVFKDAVDALGGVPFNVPEDMTVDYANNPDDSRFIPAGEQILDGDAALRVCRYRDYVMGDLQRIYIQQSFIKAMLKQCMKPANIFRLPAVYRAVMRNLQSDMTSSNIRYIGFWSLLSYKNEVVQNTLPGDGVFWDGSACIALFGQNVVNLVNQVLNPFYEPITIEESTVYTVHLNDYGEYYIDKSYAEGEGFDAAAFFDANGSVQLPEIQQDDAYDGYDGGEEDYTGYYDTEDYDEEYYYEEDTEEYYDDGGMVIN